MSLVRSRPLPHLLSCTLRPILQYSRAPSAGSAAVPFSSPACPKDNAASAAMPQPANATKYMSASNKAPKLLGPSSKQTQSRDTTMQLKLDDMMRGKVSCQQPPQSVQSASHSAGSKTKGIKRKAPKRAKDGQGTSFIGRQSQSSAQSANQSASDRRKSAPRPKPSEASGGVPEPSPLYLTRSLGPPSILPQPRRILVIMDLNGTLLFRPSKKRPFDFVERPHAREFMSYCLDTFFVAIWSSARPANVNKMVTRLLSPQQCSKCVVTWARDQFGLSEEDYDMRIQCYKRLTRIWRDEQVIASHPNAAAGQHWDQTNTILVDDSVEKGRSEPNNILQIPEFSGMDNEPPHVLPQVHDYLNQLSHQSDISRFVRQNPFKLNSNYNLAADTSR